MSYDSVYCLLDEIEDGMKLIRVTKDLSLYYKYLGEIKFLIEQIRISIYDEKYKYVKTNVLATVLKTEQELLQLHRRMLEQEIKVGRGEMKEKRKSDSELIHEAGLSRLNRAREQLVETEEVGRGIVENLGIQEEKMNGTRNRLNGVNEELKQSNSLMSRMMRWWRS